MTEDNNTPTKELTALEKFQSLKWCAQCQHERPLTSFSIRPNTETYTNKTQERFQVCNDCYKVLNERFKERREEAKANKQSPEEERKKELETKKRNRALCQMFMQEWLQSHPCVDCKNDDWRVLMFSRKKCDGYNNKSVLEMVQFGMMYTLRHDINNHEVICANCLRIRAFEKNKLSHTPKPRKDRGLEGNGFSLEETVLESDEKKRETVDRIAVSKGNPTRPMGTGQNELNPRMELPSRGIVR